MVELIDFSFVSKTWMLRFLLTGCLFKSEYNAE